MAIHSSTHQVQRHPRCAASYRLVSSCVHGSSVALSGCWDVVALRAVGELDPASVHCFARVRARCKSGPGAGVRPSDFAASGLRDADGSPPARASSRDVYTGTSALIPVRARILATLSSPHTKMSEPPADFVASMSV